MKKSIIAFTVFVLVFLGSLGLIYYEANPTTRLADEYDPLEWHGHIENEYGTYDGALIGDLFSGEGRFRFLSGESYTGEWNDSYMSGTGIVTFPKVGIYSGELSDSMRNGRGVFTWDTGECYDGDWENDEMSGNGTYTFSNGSTLAGQFQNNKPVSGVLSYKSEAQEDDPETAIVSMQYAFSATENRIVFTTKGGLEYDGDLSGLVGIGNATITYPSGNTYTGQLDEGRRSGSGTYIWRDSEGNTLSYYEGDWSSDHMDGSGKYHFSSAEYPYLSGAFTNDVPSGTLVYYKEAGNTFDTKWENGTCVSIKET